MKSSLKKILINGFLLSIISLATTLTSLFITNRGFYIFSYDIKAVILSFILIFGFSILIYSISSIIISVFITFNFFSLLSTVSMIKYEKRNLPLIFDDFSFFNEVKALSGIIDINDYMLLIISIIAAEIIILTLLYFIKKRMDFKSNIGIRIFGVFFSIILLFSSYTFIDKMDINFEKSGPIYTFFSSIQNSSEYKLSDDEENLLETLIEEKETNDTSPNNDEKTKPNIIIIMNEAFWDMDQLPNIDLTPNPYDYFNELKEESAHGRLEVPVFAGGTSNTEFEVLSSISTHMYNEGLMVFNSEIQGPTITLASVLRNQGYYSVGLHPFWGWYYNRNAIYNNLGFDEFITEEFIDQSKVKGYYISDETDTEVIIDKIDSIDQPLFLYTVTIQNHGPYDDGRYDNIDLDIEITGDTIDSENQELLEVYGQGIYDAVESLKTLIDYLKNSDEDTIVVFFGDHLPLMGDNLKVYKDTDFLDESDDYVKKYIQMRTTPLIIWSNFDDTSKDIGIMDATFLGPYLLENENLEMPNYFKYMADLSKNTPFINPAFLVYDENYYFNESDVYKNISNPMIAIQKDIMYGERLFENDTDWAIDNNLTFNQAIKDIKITNAYFQGSDLIIEGNNLYSKSILYIDNKKVPFIKDNDNIIVSIDNITNKKRFTIKLKLIDTIEKTLAESNEYIYK
ncbi:MAG: LTA synthase family protein [Bacillota bacterium]|nr:LTA synthase family protein [Bacillota bacterium]